MNRNSNPKENYQFMHITTGQELLTKTARLNLLNSLNEEKRAVLDFFTKRYLNENDTELVIRLASLIEMPLEDVKALLALQLETLKKEYLQNWNAAYENLEGFRKKLQ